MTDRLTGKFDQDHVDGFEAMQEAGDADSYSEAIRIACNVGLQNLGYINSERKQTRLRELTRRFADAFALLGLMWLGVSFWLPLEVRMFAIAPFAASVTCYVLDRLLKTLEPAVTKRISGVFRGEKA